MIKIKRQFHFGYASPVHRGISLWLDPEKQRNTTLDYLVYDALGEEYDDSIGADLHRVTVSIEIEKATEPELPWKQSSVDG